MTENQLENDSSLVGTKMTRKVKSNNNVEELKSVVKDRQENEYYCKFSKSSFSKLDDSHSIEVFDVDAKLLKKIRKSHLSVIKDKVE